MELFRLLQEYCILSKVDSPTDRQSDRLEAILQLAQYDRELCCLINEADRLIAYELEIAIEPLDPDPNLN